MQYLCRVHVYMYVRILYMHVRICTCTRMHYAAIHVTCILVGMRLYMSTGGISQTAAIAVNRTQGVKFWDRTLIICNFPVSMHQLQLLHALHYQLLPALHYQLLLCMPIKGRYNVHLVMLEKTASMSMLTLFESRYTLKGKVQHC